MSLQKQQDFLARLFTDEGLRQNFLSAPAEIGAENDLNETEIENIKIILPEQISFFAETLFWKRLREAEKHLPLTKKFVGADFVGLFRKFSQRYNPQTIKKHLEDAIEFCRFVQTENISKIIADVSKFERTKIEFIGHGKRFAVCRLDYDVREISRAVANGQKDLPRRKTIAFWLKIGNKFKYFTI